MFYLLTYLLTNGQHSSSSCKSTSGLLHVVGSYPVILAVLKDLRPYVTYVSLTLYYKLRSFFYVDIGNTHELIILRHYSWTSQQF